MRRFAKRVEIEVSRVSSLTVDAEWDETGAVMRFDGGDGNTHIACPRCGDVLAAGVEHRCGDRLIAKRGKA